MEDSYTGSYSLYAASNAFGSVGSYNYEGESFWNRKATWLEHETSFNVDRVRTPALFTMHHENALPFALDTLGAFGANDRPIEFLMYPKGRHGLDRPRERLASQQAAVDWMSFWLLGQAPADPERATRWAILKRQQEEVLEKPTPPNGKWVFMPEENSDATTRAKPDAP
jgi:hypothetical protein